MVIWVSCLLFISAFAVILKIYAILTTGVAKSYKCLVGKTVLITGGNRGIGYATALALASRGCRLIIADKDNAEKTKQKIIKLTNNANIITKQFDLASFASVRKLAKELSETEDRLDILINNAGVAHVDPTLTEDGNANITQINHLGPFLLTHLLIDLLKKTPDSRIIFLASCMAFTNDLTVENINNLRHSRIYAYGNTKLCNIITTKVLARNLNIPVNCVFPGVVNTDIFNFRKSSFIQEVLHQLNYVFILVPFGKTPEEGAQTTLHVALSDECGTVTGKYFMDCQVATNPAKANDINFCKRIFEKSEELSGLQPHERVVKE